MQRSIHRILAFGRRLTRTARPAVVVLGTLLGAAAAAESQPTVDFGRWYPYGQALELARKHGRPALLYFRSNYCPYCEQMEMFVLSAPEVDRTLQRCTVVASVTLGRPDTEEPARHWRVFGTPTFVFVRAEGKQWVEVSRAFGSMPRALFLEFLNAVCKEEGR